MAIGLFILANTRPYEGFLLSVGVGIALLAWMVGKKGPGVRVALVRIVLPLVLTLAPLAAWTGYYYYRVTGSPFRMAYDVNRANYAMGRYFIWQKPWPQKTYRFAKVQAKYELELQEANENQTVAGFMRRAKEKIYSFWKFYLVAPLGFVLIAIAVRGAGPAIARAVDDPGNFCRGAGGGGVVPAALFRTGGGVALFVSDAVHAAFAVVFVEKPRGGTGVCAGRVGDLCGDGCATNRAGGDACASGKGMAARGHGAGSDRAETGCDARAACGAGEVRSELRS